MNEVWTLQRKRKQGQMMKRKAKVIARAKKRKLKRFADPKTLKKRAQKAAREMIFKKMAARKTKGEIESKQMIISIEKKLEKHKARINKLAIKILPKIKKKEQERFKKMKGSSVPPNS